MPDPKVAVGAEPGYTLLGPDRKPYRSTIPGTLGGHRAGKIYGPAALAAIARGGYAKNRVFFPDEATAIAAGYRPCATCLPKKYKAWKAANHSKQA